MTANIDTARRELDRDGFIRMDELLARAEIGWYLEVYESFLTGKINAGTFRSDLGAGSGTKIAEVENITQIMWPSELVPELSESSAYQRSLAIARQLMGDDMAFDFDMLIDKAPRTATLTPFHQDAAYWLDLPDARALTTWIALDRTTLDNGCMWFVPGSHKEPLRQHHPIGNGAALECAGSETEAVCVPLAPGSCTYHNGGVVHYSRGNTTNGHRRALIVNFRPAAMIRLERERGFDHGKSANVRINRNERTR
jgi:ectoine hydroxylase-related dioxygenase (phytanoyl-CoA dioxygenase family)